MSEQTAQKAHHWLLVGFVSDQAKAWIEECGGIVRQVNEEPKLFTVGLAYDPAGKWVFSKGESQLRRGVEFWTTGEIQEASTGINLQYRNTDPHISAEYCSAEGNYLILPDEEYDTTTGTVKEPGGPLEDDSLNLPSNPFEGDLEELGDHPF